MFLIYQIDVFIPLKLSEVVSVCFVALLHSEQEDISTYFLWFIFMKLVMPENPFEELFQILEKP